LNNTQVCTFTGVLVWW